MLSHAASAIRAAGVMRLAVVAPGEPADAATKLAGAADGAEVVVQPQPLGTADALLSARRACEGAGGVLAGPADAPLTLGATLEKMMRKHERSGALATVLTARTETPYGMGRVARDSSGRLASIVEEADAAPEELEINEVNAGWYCFDPEWLWESLERVRPSRSGEKYLTDLVETAAREGAADWLEAADADEALGVNDMSQLAKVESVMRDRIRGRWMLAGVRLNDPATIYIDVGASLGRDTVVLPGTHVLGGTRVGSGCRIGPGTWLSDCVVSDGASVASSHCEGASIGANASVGPYSRLRPGAKIGPDVHVGNYAEVKSSEVGRGSRVGHFSYIGDAEVGRDVNIGAGSVTCNFDGKNKHRTIIGDGAFIGSGTMLVAPVEIGPGGRTGAGSVVTRDVAAGDLVVGVPARRGAVKRQLQNRGGDNGHDQPR